MVHILTIATTVLMMVFSMCHYYYVSKVQRRAWGPLEASAIPCNVLSSPGVSLDGVKDRKGSTSTQGHSDTDEAVPVINFTGGSASDGLLGSTPMGQAQHFWRPLLFEVATHYFVFSLFSLLINFNIPNTFSIKSF